VLAARQAPDPVAGPGQVVVRTSAADVLFVDTPLLAPARSASPARLRAPAVGVFPPRSSQALLAALASGCPL